MDKLNSYPDVSLPIYSVSYTINQNDYSNMIQILGKKFFEITKINKEYGNIMSNIRKEVDKYNPTLSASEKENLSYRCFYDRLVYGATMTERRILDFEHKSPEEKSSYVTYQKLGAYVRVLNNTADAVLFTSKHKQYKLLKEYFQRDALPIQDETDFEDFCQFVKKHPVFLLKISSGSLGAGVTKIKVEDYKSLRELFKELLSKKKVLILEEMIDQSEEMSLLHPQSVNTVRLTTVIVDNKIHIVWPFLKVGVGNSVVDNGGAGGCLAGINLQSGVVDTNFFDEFNHWADPLEYHPDTKVQIKGFQIPRWNEACNLVQEIAYQLIKRMNVNYVGWDLALTPKGWVLVEGNTKGFLLAPQLVYKKPLRWEFEKLINWKSE